MPWPHRLSEALSEPSFKPSWSACPANISVLVRYGPHHDAGMEWVYNSADIDGSKVIWARG